jgi:hypothetical protein
VLGKDFEDEEDGHEIKNLDYTMSEENHVLVFFLSMNI